MKNKACTITKQILPLPVLFLCVALFILFPQNASSGARNGLLLCAENLIPSLFPMCALSIMICDTVGSMNINGRAKITSCIILSAICGYPVGAKIVNQLYCNGLIEKKTAKLLICLCVNPGPAFVVIFIGKGLMNSAAIGYFLFASVTVSYFLPIAILWKKLAPASNTTFCQSDISFSSAIEKSADCTINICALTVLFFTVFSVLQSFVSENVSVVLKSVCEITSGVSAAYKFPFAVAFLLGFGGLSVHAQIYSSVKNIKPNYLSFLAFRIIAGIVSMIIFKILLTAFPIALFISSAPKYNGTHATLPAFISLIITVLVFLYSIGKTGIVKNRENMV